VRISSQEAFIMIAVRAIYEQGRINLLEPAPTINKAFAVVVFLEDHLDAAPSILRQDVSQTIEWGEPMDEEGAQFLMAVHEELAPYRIEAAVAGPDALRQLTP
jgi:hypothetical protein